MTVPKSYKVEAGDQAELDLDTFILNRVMAFCSVPQAIATVRTRRFRQDRARVRDSFDA
jgi:hypothetical protein